MDRRGDVHVLPALAGPAEAWVNNDAGEAAGYGWDTPDLNAAHALFWTRQHRLLDLAGLPQANGTFSFGISQTGWVVGYSEEVSETGVLFAIAWVWTHRGPLVPLPTPAGQQSIAHDVLENGLIVGAVGKDVGGLDLHAATWSCTTR